MRIIRILIVLFTITLIAGCKGVFERNWTISNPPYCDTTSGTHLVPGNRLLTSSSDGRAIDLKTPDVIGFELLGIEDRANRVWARVRLPDSDTAHWECLLIERADDILEEKGIEIFLFAQDDESVPCQTLIDDAVKAEIREGVNCGMSHKGGWKAY